MLLSTLRRGRHTGGYNPLQACQGAPTPPKRRLAEPSLQRIANQPFCRTSYVPRGVGCGLGVGVDLGVAVGVTVAVAVGVGVTVAVTVSVAVAVAVAVGVGVVVGVTAGVAVS
jgi:hypothetical protein